MKLSGSLSKLYLASLNYLWSNLCIYWVINPQCMHVVICLLSCLDLGASALTIATSTKQLREEAWPSRSISLFYHTDSWTVESQK